MGKLQGVVETVVDLFIKEEMTNLEVYQVLAFVAASFLTQYSHEPKELNEMICVFDNLLDVAIESIVSGEK